MATIASGWTEEATDCDSVTLDPVGQIVKFDEKVSMEGDMIINGKIYGYITEGGLIDIGTPKRYEEAKRGGKWYGTSKKECSSQW